jgi:hypothetical protein
MKTFLSAKEGAGGSDYSSKGQDTLTADVTRYLTTVIQPSRGTSLSLRNERELRTLAESMDCLLRGQVGQAGDILMQRFKAVEAASGAEGSWALAARYELIPASQISAVPPQEREAAMTLELKERKLAALLAPRKRE